MPRRRQWEADHCFGLDYLPGCAGAGDPRRALVRRFKAGDRGSVQLAGDVMISALLAGERRLLRHANRWHLVPAPGHRAGSAGRPLDLLSRRLADTVPWMVYQPAQLIRTRPIRQSSASVDRPTQEEHLGSLALRGGRIQRSVIIVDDVFSFGMVSRAARLLAHDSGATDVVVACLAVTRL
jgi:predicted amidophosphoribosyltransferase